MIDKTSSPINVGDLVRLVELQMDAFGHLDSNEIADIRSMIGETFSVEKVTTTGSLTVTNGSTVVQANGRRIRFPYTRGNLSSSARCLTIRSSRDRFAASCKYH